MRVRCIAFVALLLVALVAGCGGSDPAPTATPEPPTPTPAPPTPTPIAFTAPPIVRQYISGARAIALDTFDTLSTERWRFNEGSVTTSLGEAQLAGVSDWGSFLYNTMTLQERTAVLVRFRGDQHAEFGIYFESGEWGSDGYKRFGTYGPYPQTNIFRGTMSEPRQDFKGDLFVQPDVWYQLMLIVAPGGKFVAVIWDPDDASQNLVYQRVVDQRWAGSEWIFGITANSGFVTIDDFTVLSFDALLT